MRGWSWGGPYTRISGKEKTKTLLRCGNIAASPRGGRPGRGRGRRDQNLAVELSFDLNILVHMGPDHIALDSVFHALADPTRRAVVQRLAQGSATVSELAGPFDMALPSFMKHIGVLEASGLIGSSKTGRVRTCTLKRQTLLATEHWFEDQRKLWQNRYEALDNLLVTLNGGEDES
ncbi:MAG: ArsR/SmtB family transcription factor [Pseudodonghicola sp.]